MTIPANIYDLLPRAEQLPPAVPRNCAILGVGAYRPRRTVTNSEIIETVESTEEWVRSRTGIVQRRWADATETLEVMASAAAHQALRQARLLPEQIDLVIVCTVSNLRQTPALAPLIAHHLGSNAAAFDLSAGCAGFCHGLALAQQVVRGGTASHALVIGVERLTDLLDHSDRSTAFLFGDGAGAVVVGPSAHNGFGPVVWGSDGSQHDCIRQNQPWNLLMDQPGASASWRLEGQAVYRWATGQVAQVARQALDAAGLKPEDLVAFVPHQANLRIIESLVAKLHLPDHVAVARDVQHFGNTSSASIPMALDNLLRCGAVGTGGPTLLLGFGAGLSYAAQLVLLPGAG